MAIFGDLATVRSQSAAQAWLRPAFAYLDDLFRTGSVAWQNLKSLAVGENFRRELPDGNFALEQVLFFSSFCNILSKFKHLFVFSK